ncbi:MAG: sugar phosphate isomerase/epimerase family protein [Candidatus Latescibacteria bacterium]|jgi:sugar phosphate isomerase/epimerase|nr:sugar phosphate isomerase/epimerase family protein [Candidatus Latescibacterota bacterium]
MANLIACNLNSYRQFCNEAYEHLARIGLTNVEIPCPAADEAGAKLKELDGFGLKATTIIVQCRMEEDDAVKQVTASLDVVQQMGVQVVFTSVKAGDLDRGMVYGRLREIGDAAAARGIVVAMETHPDLITNGDVARETMEGVNHPNVRVNFDTGNVHFYNENVTAVGELEKIIDFVGAVHLKDTNGGYQTWHFPALGEGVVDYPAVFGMLKDKGFTGPYTMELEGIRDEEITKADVERRVEKSLEYLRSHGLMD